MACNKCKQGGSTSCKCNKKNPTVAPNCCVDPVNTDCVIYNQAPNRSSLKCFLGLDNNVPLTKILERIDELLCIKPSDCAKAKFGLGCDTSATIILHKLLDYVCDLGDVKVKASSSDKTAGNLFEKISLGDCLGKALTQDVDGNQTVRISIDYDCLALRFPCCGPGAGVAISISGANSICGNNTAILTASTNCTGTITWSNGLTGLTIQASAGTYYATCGGVQSNTITVTNTGSCNCVVSTWNFTGAERCLANNSEVEQISNCGTYRWISGGNACTQANCVPVRFQNNTNQVQTFSYQCQGQVPTASIPAYGCIVVNTVIGEWTITTPGSITPTVGGTCGSFNRVRTQNFTKVCTNGCVGSVIPYSQTYTSYVSQLDADNLAANDPSFITNGQNYANNNGTCTGSNCNGCTITSWTNNGNTRCELGVSQIQQTSNCNTTQWINGGNSCSNACVIPSTVTINGSTTPQLGIPINYDFSQSGGNNNTWSYLWASSNTNDIISTPVGASTNITFVGGGSRNITFRVCCGITCTGQTITVNPTNSSNCLDYHLIQTGNQVRWLDCTSPVPSTNQIIYNGTGNCNFQATSVILGTLGVDYALGTITCPGCTITLTTIN